MTKTDNIEIEVTPRKAGKGQSRGLRSDQRVPAVVYGPKTSPLSFSLPELEAGRYSSRQYENVVLTLKSTDSQLNNLKVLKKETTYHKVTRRPVHMDFYAVDLTQTVKVHVEVKYEGRAEGVRDGGVFSALRRDIEIECLPTEIPEAFTLDITEMKLNQVLHVSDINVSDKFKVITSSDEAIATIAEVKEEVAVEPTAEAEGDAAAAADAKDKPEEKKS